MYDLVDLRLGLASVEVEAVDAAERLRGETGQRALLVGDEDLERSCDGSLIMPPIIVPMQQMTRDLPKPVSAT